MYSYDIVENKLPRWVSRGYVVSVGTVKLSGQVQDREEKVNPVQKIKSGDRNITTKIEKLVHPYDMIACNEPGRVLDGVDMGGVEAAST